MDLSANLVDLLAARAAQLPQKTLYVCDGRATSYAQFYANAQNLARALRDLGAHPNDRICYIGKNSDAFFTLFYAAMMIGAVSVPVNWRLAGPEITTIIEDAQSQIIVVGPEFVELIKSHRAEIPRVRHILAAEPETLDFPSLQSLWQNVVPAPLDHISTQQDVAVQLYTSGTTGRPKGVMLSHHNLVATFGKSELHDLGWNKWHQDDVALLAMPVSHISGTGWGVLTVFHGATCHIQRQFEIELTLDMITEHRVSKIFLVPAALQFLVRHPRAATTDFSSITTMGYGASPMPLALLQESMGVLRCQFAQFYGMTETTGTIVALPPSDHETGDSPRLRAAGLPLPWVELRIVDVNNNEVPCGTVGEVVTRSTGNMVGYWNRPEETAKTIDAEGWLHTGDAAYMDEDGYVFIFDRIKDMIITGGENVYPAEVESALSAHPAIAEVAVIGVPDSKWGESVKAVVVLRPNASLTEAELIDWAKPRIAGFKSPKSVDFATTLPRNASGKILKRDLRAAYWQNAERQVN